MAYAIIETGGKQLWVEPGRFYDIERLNVEPDASVSIDKVFLVHDGESATVGTPLVKGATVEGTVVQHLRDRKIIVYKMQPKKKTRKKQGHRQELTRLMINSIEIDGKVIGGEAASKKTTKKAKAAPKEAEPETVAAATDSE